MRKIDVMAILSVGCAALVACGQRQTASGREDTAPKQTATGGATVAPNVVTVRGSDYHFDGPTQVPAGLTTFRFINDGPGIHHMMIVRMDSGKTLADWQREHPKDGPFPAWAVPVGGPDAPDPKAEANATVNLAPGNYALICIVDVPGGVLHSAKGMVLPLTVTPASGPAASPPTPDISVTLSDFKFDVSGPMTAGHHTVAVTNTATQPHEIEVLRLEPGKSFTDLLDWFGKLQGPPPAHGVGGIAPIVAGSTEYFTADFTPGNYVIVCFIADATDGKPHFVHGMVRTIAVS